MPLGRLARCSAGAGRGERRVFGWKWRILQLWERVREGSLWHAWTCSARAVPAWPVEPQRRPVHGRTVCHAVAPFPCLKRTCSGAHLQPLRLEAEVIQEDMVDAAREALQGHHQLTALAAKAEQESPLWSAEVWHMGIRLPPAGLPTRTMYGRQRPRALALSVQSCRRTWLPSPEAGPRWPSSRLRECTQSLPG